MKRARVVAAAGALICLAACGTSSGAETIGECGDIHFPAGARIVHDTGVMAFTGDQHIEMVAEFPSADLAAFSAASHIQSFTPGVPRSWQNNYWQDSGVADSLRAESNESFSEWDGSTGREVVVHRLDSTTVRVFARGLC